MLKNGHFLEILNIIILIINVLIGNCIISKINISSFIEWGITAIFVVVGVSFVTILLKICIFKKEYAVFLKKQSLVHVL